MTADAATLERLAEQALENLVNPFARPMDFLRELVQNVGPAGSTSARSGSRSAWCCATTRGGP